MVVSFDITFDLGTFGLSQPFQFILAPSGKTKVPIHFFDKVILWLFRTIIGTKMPQFSVKEAFVP